MIKPRTDFLLWLLLPIIGCCPLLVGCLSLKPASVTDEERKESFEVGKDLKIGPQTLGDYLVERAAFMLNAADFEVTERPSDDELHFNMKLGGDKQKFSTATAIDPRGYFVTGAHCVDEGDLVMFFRSKKGIQFEKVRVVWTGYSLSNQLDFAIVHIPAKIDLVFEWAENIESGTPVFSAGTNFKPPTENQQLGLSMQPLGGLLIKVSHEKFRGIPFKRLLHESPLDYGNSGGPLINPEGQLLGINVTKAAALPNLTLPKYRYCNAFSPDIAWVKAVIDEDAKRFLR